MTMSLFPLHTCRTEHLQTLEPAVRHGQPVHILDVLHLLPGVPEYLTDVGYKTEVQGYAFSTAFFIARS